MRHMIKYSENQITVKLLGLNNWSYINYAIEKKFVFDNHISCFGFMTKVALLAEKYNHHPNWYGGYNEVTIRLFTHDIDGVTKKDIDFAGYIDKL